MYVYMYMYMYMYMYGYIHVDHALACLSVSSLCAPATSVDPRHSKFTSAQETTAKHVLLQRDLSPTPRLPVVFRKLPSNQLDRCTLGAVDLRPGVWIIGLIRAPLQRVPQIQNLLLEIIGTT